MTYLDTGTDDLLAEADDGVAVLTMNQPHRLNRAVDGDLGECMDIEATHRIHTGLTKDYREAAKAFVERRGPRFAGR